MNERCDWVNLRDDFFQIPPLHVIKERITHARIPSQQPAPPPSNLKWRPINMGHQTSEPGCSALEQMSTVKLSELPT